MRLSVILTLATGLALVFAGGCGGTETDEQASGGSAAEETTSSRALIEADTRTGEQKEADKATEAKPNIPQNRPEESKSAAEQQAEIQAKDGNEPVVCQLEKARADLGEEDATRLIEEWNSESLPSEQRRQELEAQGLTSQEVSDQLNQELQSAPTLPEFLAERGYTC